MRQAADRDIINDIITVSSHYASAQDKRLLHQDKSSVRRLESFLLLFKDIPSCFV